MYSSRHWFRNSLPPLVRAALVLLAWVSIRAHAQSSGVSLAELITPQQIHQEEFEPAVGEQIRAAYQQALHRPGDTEAVGRLGMIFQCYGKYTLAEICFRGAHALEPKSSRWAYYLGNVEAWLGKDREAIDHVRESLRIDPNYTPARVRLGQLLFEAGDIEQSRQVFEEAIRQRPRLAAAHLGLGR